MIVFGNGEGLRELNRDLSKYIAETGTDAYNEARIVGRNLAVRLASYTFPQGDKKADSLDGESAVERDILKVYTTVPDVYEKLSELGHGWKAAGVWRAYKQKKWGQLRKILQKTEFSDMEMKVAVNKAHHQAARTGARRSVNLSRPKQIVGNPKSINAYIRKRKRKVGLAKSGWAHAAKDLGGTRGIPAWAGVNRHKSPKLGGASHRKRGFRPGVVLENTAEHVFDSLPRSQEKAAIRSTSKRLRKRLLHMQNRRNKKFNRAA